MSIGSNRRIPPPDELEGTLQQISDDSAEIYWLTDTRLQRQKAPTDIGGRQAEARQRPITYTDYAALNDGQRYQVFSGMLVAEPAPTTFHQQVVMNLAYLIKSHTNQARLGGILLISPVDLILDPIEQLDVLQPDIVWVRPEHMEIVSKVGIFGVPDLVVEVLSPSNALQDRREKIPRYMKSGVPYIWLLDPEDRVFEEIVGSKGAYEAACLCRDKDVVKPRCFQGLAFSLSEVWPDE